MPETPNTATRILIVEPDFAQRSRFVGHLEACGYVVESYETGEQARSVVSDLPTRVVADRPDIVISELALEQGSGIDLLIQVKSLLPGVSVVLTSSQGSARDVVEALRKGVDDYIVKPLDDLAILDRVVEKALNHAQLAKEHAEARKELKRLNSELVESMHALQRDQDAGRMVQERLLPPSRAQFEGFDLSFEIVPSFYLSGDTIDYGLVGSRYLAFYLTDVSGHGAASAFVTVWIKQLVRSFFRDQSVLRTRTSFELDIPRLMHALNEELVAANIGPHLTCFVGVIDTKTLEMNYVVGGHLPLPMIFENGELRVLLGQGKPLGLFPAATWKQETIRLEKDFSLVVFSDGALELMEGRTLIEKEQALADLLRQANPTELKHIRNSLPLQNHDTVPDDVAMLFVRRTDNA